MVNRLIDDDGEVRELTKKDFAHAKTVEQSDLPETFKKMARGQGQRGPQKSTVKQMIAIRMSPEVIAYFKAQGKGWQTQINDVLKDYIESR